MRPPPSGPCTTTSPSRGSGAVCLSTRPDRHALITHLGGEPIDLCAPPAGEAGSERPGGRGADRVFAMEAERGVEIRERLMEYELDGEFTFSGDDADPEPPTQIRSPPKRPPIPSFQLFGTRPTDGPQ